MDLPDDLRTALEETLHTTTSRSLAHLAEDLSQRYRTGHAQGKQRSSAPKKISLLTQHIDSL
jgi:hypothetical protein